MVIIASLISIFSFYGTESDNYVIQIENENFQIYSNQPYATQIVEKCKSDVHCSVNALNTLSKLENQKNVLDIFSNIVASYESKYPCHEIGHHLGMWLNAYLDDPQEALDLAKQQCGGSIFHGVIQNYLQIQKFKNVPIDEIDIQEICSKFENDPSFINRWQCLHGLGHGLTDIYNYDVQSAVNRCEEFKPGLEQISCSKGVFMQNAVHWAETGTADFDENDLLYPCNAVYPKFAPACYHYHSSYMALRVGGIQVQIPEAFDLCDEISPEEMVKYCYYGMGREMQSRTYLDWDRALFLCQQGDQKELHQYCIQGMVMTLVNLNSDPSLGFSFCKSLPLEYKQSCYDGLGKWITMLSSNNDEQQQLCSMAENKVYFDSCANARTDSLKLL